MFLTHLKHYLEKITLKLNIKELFNPIIKKFNH